MAVDGGGDGATRDAKRKRADAAKLAREQCRICKGYGHWGNECPQASTGHVNLAALPNGQLVQVHLTGGGPATQAGDAASMISQSSIGPSASIAGSSSSALTVDQVKAVAAAYARQQGSDIAGILKMAGIKMIRIVRGVHLSHAGRGGAITMIADSVAEVHVIGGTDVERAFGKKPLDVALCLETANGQVTVHESGCVIVGGMLFVDIILCPEVTASLLAVEEMTHLGVELHPENDGGGAHA